MFTSDSNHMLAMQKILPLFFMLCIIATLQGCMDVATSGAQMVYNRRSIQNNVNDQYVTMQAFQALNYKTTQFKNANIAIATYNNEILLAGQVPEAWQREKAEAIIKTLPDIDHVYNELQIARPSPSLIRISDAWITAKVKSQLIASDDVDATKIKVVTENGTVYLMGVLPPYEARVAFEIASDTEGVTKVVKLFSYIHISRVG